MKTTLLLTCVLAALLVSLAPCAKAAEPVGHFASYLDKAGRLDIPANTDADGSLFVLRFLSQISNRVTLNPQNLRPDQLHSLCKSEVDLIETLLREKGNPLRVKNGNDLLLKICANVRAGIEKKDVYCEAVAGIDKSLNIRTEDYRVLPDWLVTPSPFEGWYFAPKSTDFQGMVAELGVEVGKELLIAGVQASLGAIDKSHAESRAEEERARLKSAKYVELRNRLEDESSALFKERVTLAHKLAKANDWTEGEYGFDMTDEEKTIFSSRDLSTKYIALLRAHARKRPRDPFAKLDLAYAVSRVYYAPEDLAAYHRDLRDAAVLCFEAASLIPPSEKLQRYRLNCLVVAGELLNKAASVNALLRDEGRFSASPPDDTAKTAVAVWDSVLQLASDPTGEIRMKKFIALAMSGQFKEAFCLAREVKDLRKKVKCPTFAYSYAALCTLHKDYDDALEWLKFGFKECGLKANHWRLAEKDKDLTNLRGERFGEFSALGKGVK